MSFSFSEIKTSIQNGDLEGAGKQLLEFTQEHSLRFHNEVVGQLASLKQVLTDERKGIASSDDTKKNKNRITYALLDLIDEIEEEISSGVSTSQKESARSDKGVIFTGNVERVVIQQSNSGDNIGEKKERVIEFGDNAQIGQFVVADSIENSFNALAKSDVNDETKAMLEQLLKAINEINKNATPEHAETAEEMVKDAESLIKEVTSAKPRRKWYEVSIEGLKQAAINIGEVATPVLDIVGKLTPLLLG